MSVQNSKDTDTDSLSRLEILMKIFSVSQCYQSINVLIDLNDYFNINVGVVVIKIERCYPSAA